MGLGVIDRNKLPKTKELFVHVCDRLKDEKTFGATVLNKVLYHVDNIAYQFYSEPVTGFSYVRQVNGPTPKPNQFLSIRDSLIAEGRIEIQNRKYFRNIQKVHRALESADMNVFSADEVVLIEEVIEMFKDINGSSASNATHDLLAWQIARPMEELPFHTYLLGTGSEDLSEADLEWIRESISNRNDRSKSSILPS